MPSDPFNPNDPTFQYLTSMMSSREHSDTHAAGGCLAVVLLAVLAIAAFLLSH
ncbi:MAG TPA: hypothetical protein VIJ77_02985 [Candidatus Tumulicola sp.]